MKLLQCCAQQKTTIYVIIQLYLHCAGNFIFVFSIKLLLIVEGKSNILGLVGTF